LEKEDFNVGEDEVMEEVETFSQKIKRKRNPSWKQIEYDKIKGIFDD
jgi:hypothetical protein